MSASIGYERHIDQGTAFGGVSLSPDEAVPAYFTAPLLELRIVDPAHDVNVSLVLSRDEWADMLALLSAALCDG